MESNFAAYDYLKSFERIDAILDASDQSYEELDAIPSRSKLTFTNGFYVQCSALFVDMRGSSELPEKHRRPTLAKIYRSYLSEVVAVMNGNDRCAEVTIAGDCVWGVFDTPQKYQVDGVFCRAARVASLIKVLSCKLRRRSIEPITVGIGISYGRALMIKAGYSGSGINDVVWMGEVVNDASSLAGFGNASWGDYQMMVAKVIYDDLNDDYKALLSWNANRGCYHGNVINKQMEEWYSENCED